MENPLPESEPDSAEFGPSNYEVSELLRDWARANGWPSLVVMGKRPGQPLAPVLIVDMRSDG